MIAELLGGIGLFLLGMILLTDGLKALAADALRRILERFVRGPLTGLVWGAAITGLIQSSSATTLMTIGFVSAGLLTFAQSVGVIFGANLGTTSTGWIVSVIGLKFSMNAVALPLIGAGAVMRLLGGDRYAPTGFAIAGFGMIFAGIEMLKSGMAGLAMQIDPASFPALTLVGVPLLILIGAAMTVLMQSSSAAVATTLAALHSGALTIEQAAVLVIGQNIGTTVKALLASIGASIPARRTALAHILFNVLTGLVALLALPTFLAMMRRLSVNAGADHDAVSLAAFHTAFNILGVAVLLPLLHPFIRMIERLIPERMPALDRHLDPSVAGIPSVAEEAARRTAIDIAAFILEAIRRRLVGDATRRETASTLASAFQAIGATQRFLGQAAAASTREAESARHLTTVHALEHLSRLAEAAVETHRMTTVRGDADLTKLAHRVVARIEESFPALAPTAQPDDAEAARINALEAFSRSLAQTRKQRRAALLQQCAGGRLPATDAIDRIDAYLWLDRIGYHLWRAMDHLQKSVTDAETYEPGPGSSPVPTS